VAEALIRWPSDGVPERPGAWLMTTARHRAIDLIRREARYRDKLALVAALPASASREPDDRLRLIFTCCHPALDPDAQVALTLRAVAGLTTAEIARAFVIPESTLAKRLTRTKQKIVSAHIPYQTPEPDEWPGRLHQVLRVIYLIFNEGYLTTSGERAERLELAHDAEWLAALLVSWLPEEPEPLGLLALIRMHLARWAARMDDDSQLVLLEHQDRAVWNRRQIDEATELLERAGRLRKPGAYQVEAAIQAVHCEAESWKETDWFQLLQLYSMLAAHDASPTILLSRAIVLGQLHGPEAALHELEALRPALSNYHLFHASRAVLLERLGRTSEAMEANHSALTRTSNVAERALIEERLGDLGARDADGAPTERW